MKKIITLFFLISGSYIVQAQQIQQLSHYVINNFAYNPAVAGASDKFISKFAFRKQWVGLDGSPTTVMASVHGNLDTEGKDLGVGALLFTDATGPIRRTGVQLAYAYHIPIEEDETYLGLGIGANFLQYSIDFTKMDVKDEGDPQLAPDKQSKLGGDAHLGAFLKSSDYWAGISINQLFASKYKFVTEEENIQNARHIYATAGYKFRASEDFHLIPSFLLKAVAGTKPQVELTARGVYNAENVKPWLGLSYRTEDALSVLLGLQIASGLNVAYAYDITTSDLSTVSSGAHEITLGYNFSIY